MDNEYGVKIVMVSSWSYGFDRLANNRCAEATEQGYRFHSASPLNVQVHEGKTFYSQSFVFKKGGNH